MMATIEDEIRSINNISKRLEASYMTEKRRNRYIALEELNFIWDEDDVKRFITMWKEGINFWKIANEFQRDPDEVAVLMMSLVREGKIEPRRLGLMPEWSVWKGGQIQRD